MTGGLKSHGAALAQLIRTIRLVAFDFDGVFTDNMVYVFEDGREAVRLHAQRRPRAEQRKGLGVAAVIISTETNPSSGRAAAAGDSMCAGLRRQARRPRGLAADSGFRSRRSPSSDNDINDLPAHLRRLPIVVRDAHPDVVPHAYYQTRRRAAGAPSGRCATCRGRAGQEDAVRREVCRETSSALKAR